MIWNGFIQNQSSLFSIYWDMHRIKRIICLSLMVSFMAFGIILALEFYLAGHIDKLFKIEAAKVSSAADISWKSVQIRLLHLDVVLHSAKVKASTGHQLGIERIILSNTLRFPLKRCHTIIQMEGIHFFENLEHTANIQMEGIHFFEIPEHTANKPNEISYFDLLKMKAAIYLEVFYDPVRENLTIKKLRLTDKNWGQLELKLVLNNFHPRQIWNLQFDPLLIQTVDLKYTDYALLKQLMVCHPEQNCELRSFMAETINLVIETAENNNNQAQLKSLVGLQNFFENPGQLTFSMRLRQPVSLYQVIHAHKVSELFKMIHYSFINA